MTRFVFRAHPVSMVYAGPIFWEQSQAAQIMRWYRDFLPKAPPELGIFIGLKTVPSTDPFPRHIWGQRICALISCYAGTQDAGEAAMRPVRNELPPPLLDWMSMMPFPTLQGLFDRLLPKGLQCSDSTKRALSDASLSDRPSGACHRPEGHARGARDATWSMVIAAIDGDPAKAPALKSWAKAYWEGVHPYNLGGGYVNFMHDDEGDARVRASYGANYERLAAVKRKYDPENLFRVNQSISPSA